MICPDLNANRKMDEHNYDQTGEKPAVRGPRDWEEEKDKSDQSGKGADLDKKLMGLNGGGRPGTCTVAGGPRTARGGGAVRPATPG